MAYESAPGVAPENLFHDFGEENVDASVSDYVGWMRLAACADAHDPRFFSSNLLTQEEVTKEFCDGCIVRSRCLEYALANSDLTGAWGGLPEDKVALRRKAAKRKNS